MFSYFYFSVVEFGKQLGEKVSIKDLHALVMLELCQKLNIERAVGCDYRHLAAHFDMSSDDIHLISQKKDPTKEVLKWLGQNPQNTVAKFRETLEVCLVYESSVSDEYLLLPQTLNWLDV